MAQHSSHPSSEPTCQTVSPTGSHWGLSLLWLPPALFLLLVVFYGILTRQSGPEDAAPGLGNRWRILPCPICAASPYNSRHCVAV